MSTVYLTDEEKALDKNSIFIKNSKYGNNDELIKYHLREKQLLDYKCYADKCPTKNGKWRRKDLYLILERKNNKQSDLRVENLRLLCPNCYCQDKGPKMFSEAKQKIERKCKSCGYILSNRFKSNVCTVCRNKMNKIDFQLTTDDYANLVNITLDTNANTSAAYVNEYSDIIDSNLDNIGAIAPVKSKLKLKSHSSRSKRVSNSSNTNNSLIDTIDINLNIDLDNSLMDKLNNI